ncbi:peptide ABC transporter substrate-binding protein [Ktedonobacter racemifer]|uniref:Extracellular solute-binding protein family 5 n=1 Tax=Ktedonobacter racemifer DSM 44963 TaxID=485913 RepID=D6TIY1_KTERA|nr:peptide ABC transporter substrate-binding protein [Ktedonobacter racemifer]EFH89388.1 extracellular solute-binding protein family 5 [Ktedonobacter racemifer DSM 44963]
MKPNKKLLGKFLPGMFIMLAMLIVACGGGNSGTSSTGSKLSDDKQIYVTPYSGISDVATLDPALSTDLESISAIDTMFTGLVQLDDNLKVYGELAEKWSTSSDGLTWTFTLRPGMKFSDGNPITADDVIFSIDRALKPALKSTVAPSYLALVKDSDKRFAGKVPTLINDSLFAPDPNTVKIVTNQKAAYFLDALTYSTSYVVEKSLMQKYGDTDYFKHLSEGGCSGPFKLDKHLPGQYISFVPNDNYYGPKPQLKKFVIAFYKDPQTTYKAYKTNQVDQAGVPTANLDEARAFPNKQFRQAPELAIDYITMNYMAKPFDNIKIRQAFALSIDKDTIGQNIWKGARFATNHIIPQGMPGYNPDLKGTAGVNSTKGDKDLAKKLFQEGMQEEGYTASTFPQISFTVATSGSQTVKNEFQFVQQQWKDTLGVNVTINDEDFNKILDDSSNTVNNPKGLQMWALDWIADYPDAQDWTSLLFGKGSSNNNFNYGLGKSSDIATQQQTQALMPVADANQNSAERLSQYNKIEQQLVDDVAWIPIVQRQSSYVLKPCVKGVVDNAQLLTPPRDWTNIYKTSDSPCASTNAYK